jgi:threonine dehydrogenase-like Zn-dependent dehydrogenase
MKGKAARRQGGGAEGISPALRNPGISGAGGRAGSLIKVAMANICGSDLHIWRGDLPIRIRPEGSIFEP